MYIKVFGDKANNIAIKCYRMYNIRRTGNAVYKGEKIDIGRFFLEIIKRQKEVKNDTKNSN